ncbi:MAG: VanZ family protein [Nitrospinae bacterium]|nr:VanZ family protein [Nitrospinota bacterium]
MNLFPNRRRGWEVTLGAIALIYLSLGPVGSFQLWLKSHGWQRPVSESILLFSAVTILYLVVVRLDRRTPSHLLALAGVGAAYLAMMITLAPHPSDRIHLLEYSLLTISFYYALKFDFSPPLRYPLAWMGAFASGFVDELIQRVVPTRAFDLHDALLNGAAASLALLFTGLVLEREGARS